MGGFNVNRSANYAGQIGKQVAKAARSGLESTPGNAIKSAKLKDLPDEIMLGTKTIAGAASSSIPSINNVSSAVTYETKAFARGIDSNHDNQISEAEALAFGDKDQDGKLSETEKSAVRDQYYQTLDHQQGSAMASFSLFNSDPQLEMQQRRNDAQVLNSFWDQFESQESKESLQRITQE